MTMEYRSILETFYNVVAKIPIARGQGSEAFCPTAHNGVGEGSAWRVLCDKRSNWSENGNPQRDCKSVIE